jgi:acetyl-CoA carboxylase alpha subunit
MLVLGIRYFTRIMLSILWKSWEYKEQAAEALKLTSSDMKDKN